MMYFLYIILFVLLIILFYLIINRMLYKQCYAFSIDDTLVYIHSSKKLNPDAILGIKYDISRSMKLDPTRIEEIEVAYYGKFMRKHVEDFK